MCSGYARIRTESLYAIVWTRSVRGEAMVADDTRVSDPAAHQLTQADMEESVIIAAMPQALACTVTGGGSERRQTKGQAEP